MEETGVTENGVVWGLTSNDTITITGYSGNLTELIIPEKINGYLVTTIKGSAFSGCSGLTSIEIPNSVTSIGNEAFSGCSSLTSIEIPDSVTSIGNEAFSGCSGLTSIEISASVTSIGVSAFLSCSSLTSIEIPNSVTSIGGWAFSGCNNLTIYCEATSKPSGWHSNWNASQPIVWDCKNNNVADDGYIYGITVDGINYAIKDGTAKVAGTNARGNVVIPSSITYNSQTYSVTSIGEWAFWGCDSLTSIEIPTSVTSIGAWAFSGCSSLTSIEIPNSVTSIGYRAFYECHKLTIYCKVASKPSGWHSNWNFSDRPVVWGYKG